MPSVSRDVHMAGEMIYINEHAVRFLQIARLGYGKSGYRSRLLCSIKRYSSHKAEEDWLELRPVFRKESIRCFELKV